MNFSSMSIERLKQGTEKEFPDMLSHKVATI